MEMKEVIELIEYLKSIEDDRYDQIEEQLDAAIERIEDRLYRIEEKADFIEKALTDEIPEKSPEDESMPF